jgi:hypothetical protein
VLAEHHTRGKRGSRAAATSASRSGRPWGQILLRALLEDEEDELPQLTYLDFDEQHLKDFERPVRLHQVVAPSLAQEPRHPSC